jgi:hypothetical protein
VDTGAVSLEAAAMTDERPSQQPRAKAATRVHNRARHAFFLRMRDRHPDEWAQALEQSWARNDGDDQ